ncbi:putative hydrolase of the HAD superfamily [Pancytospora philotis]|nr:putative hydrolase of the HAD superfamily [Pancytospora philotis]
MKYVEMSTRNKKCTIAEPVGEGAALVFDIDNCLYHSPEYLGQEMTSIRSMLLDSKRLTEKEWADSFQMGKLFREVLFRVIGLHPTAYSDMFDTSEPADFLAEDAELREILQALPHRKFCFTNGGVKRARKILQHLRIEECFELVFCADEVDTEFISKPKPEAYAFVDAALGTASRSQIHFFDDSAENVAAAKSHGWNGYLVENNIKQHLREIGLRRV